MKYNFEKLFNGGNIPKFLNPASGVTYKSTGSWYTDIFSNFRNSLKTSLATAKTPEEKQAIMNLYNLGQTEYGKLRPLFTDLSKVTKNDSVSAYQDWINQNAGFVNTEGINSGVTGGRYNYLGTNRKGIDSSANNWQSDGWWGAQTLDRTTLGYEGDWDINSDEYKNWQKELNDLGMEMYLDTDKTWKLRNYTNSSSDSTIALEAGNNSDDNKNSNNNTVGIYQTPPKDEQTDSKKNREFWTDWLPLTQNLMNNLLSADRQAYWQKKKKFALQESPWQNYKVTDAYYTRQQLKKQADNVRALGLLYKSSDIDNYLRANLQAETQAQLIEDKANSYKAEEYARTLKEAQAVSNLNNLNSVNTGNQNRQILSAAYNNIINANQQRDLRRTAALNDYGIKMYANYGEWNKTQKLNELARVRNELSEARNKDLKQILDDFDKDFADYKKSREYSDFQKAMLANLEWMSANASGEGSGATISDEAWEKAWQDENKYRTHWEKRRSDALKQAELDRLRANDSWYAASVGLPEYVTNNGIYYPGMYDHVRYKSIFSQYAKGGTIRTSRLIDWNNHYLKELHNVRKNMQWSTDSILKQLKRDLDNLDRESLLLLRSVFK